VGKRRVVHRCQECGTAASKWQGRCPGCGEWNTLVEEIETAGASVAAGSTLLAADVAVPLAEVDTGEWVARPTGVGELDRVLGGGLVPGSVTLVGGEPGIGKSTLLLQMAGRMAAAGSRVLYVSAEESKQQVRLRAERLRMTGAGVFLASDTILPHLIGHLDAVKPDVVVVDSVQTIHDPELESAPGSVVQVRDCAHRLVQEAKARAVATVLVGHVTKDGSLAGPRVLEHVVDTVLAFGGDRHHALRLLRAVKHRFGSTHELGLFEMTDRGLKGVEDPSGLFLADRCLGVPGSVVVPTIEGHRPLLVEIQALIAPTNIPTPRRSAQGLDGGRLALLLAVLDRRLRLSVANTDVYASAVGGVKVAEPGADLPVALAIASAVIGVPVADDVVACGEIGLGGELRQVAQLQRRLAEAARLGFKRAIVPASSPPEVPGIWILRAGTVAEAMAHAGLT
jgi:DNA repair protein RadA/Sms